MPSRPTAPGALEDERTKDTRAEKLSRANGKLEARRDSLQEPVDALEQGEVAEVQEQVRRWTAELARPTKAHVTRAAWRRRAWERRAESEVVRTASK